jgi:hypothetical protein
MIVSVCAIAAIMIIAITSIAVPEKH